MTNATLKTYSLKATPQSEKIPGSKQVANSAGGYSFAVDNWTRLQRFLVLGSEGGSYYASERKLTLDNVENVVDCIKSDGLRVVSEIVSISEAGRAPKNDYAIFALALCFTHGDADTKRAAKAALPRVCRIGTHLFQFASFVSNMRGWGRGLRGAVAAWYEEKEAGQLAYQAIKYQSRHNFTHRDLLRLSHPSPGNGEFTNEKQALYEWLCGRNDAGVGLPRFAEGALRLKGVTDVAQAISMIADYKLPWEAVPSELLAHAEIWGALLDSGALPLGALVRNLGRMTANGLVAPGSAATRTIINKLGDAEQIGKARLHPLSVLVALNTYQQGRGVRGSLAWEPVAQVVDALDGAFYAAFGNVETTGQRYLLGLDVSGSMAWGDIAGMPGITPRVGSTAMALITAATEPEHHIMAFAHDFVPLAISPRQRLDDAMNVTDRLPFGGTDCALPMQWALKNKVEVDTFVVYTDSETWAGSEHPVQALKRYRDKLGIPARLAVCGMVANEFSIADPDDAGMLDVVGFDTATPQLLSDFSKGLV